MAVASASLTLMSAKPLLSSPAASASAFSLATSASDDTFTLGDNNRLLPNLDLGETDLFDGDRVGFFDPNFGESTGCFFGLDTPRRGESWPVASLSGDFHRSFGERQLLARFGFGNLLIGLGFAGLLNDQLLGGRLGGDDSDVFGTRRFGLSAKVFDALFLGSDRLVDSNSSSHHVGDRLLFDFDLALTLNLTEVNFRDGE